MAKKKQAAKPRSGEMGPVTYYRSDRFYSENGGWYFKTREGEELGPFDEKCDAKEALEMHILLNVERALSQRKQDDKGFEDRV